MNRKVIFVLLFVIDLLLIGGCSTSNLPPAPSTPDAQRGISISTPIRTGLFNKQAAIQIDLLNEDQLAIDASNPICVVTWNASGVVLTQCPPGNVCKNVTPENSPFGLGIFMNRFLFLAAVLN